jgi:hypothetical protein
VIADVSRWTCRHGKGAMDEPVKIDADFTEALSDGPFVGDHREGSLACRHH